MTLGVHRIELPDPPLAELLDDDDPNVQLALLQFLGQYIRYSWDAKEFLPGVDLPDKLNPLPALARRARPPRRDSLRA